MSRTHTQRANDWLFVDAIAQHFVQAGRNIPLTDLPARDVDHRVTTAARHQLFARHRHPQIEHP